MARSVLRRASLPREAVGVGGKEAGAASRDAADRVDRLMERAARAVGAHVGAVYLLVPERQTMQMTAVTGVPGKLAQPWSRVALASPVPVAEAVRSGRPVWLPDQQELARRFPRTALAFPYAVAMYVLPLLVEDSCWGAMLFLWPGTRSGELSAREAAEIDGAAERIGSTLREAAAQGAPVRPRDEPLAMEPPPGRHADAAAALTERLDEGFCALDLHGRITFLNATAAALLGRDRAEVLGSRPWGVLPWLTDPAYENAYLAAVFSRLPTGFAARRPDGAWLSFVLHPDDTGISVRIRPADAPAGQQGPTGDSPPSAPVRAGTLFHLLHLASALTEAAGVSEVTTSLTEQMMPVLGAQGLALLVADEGRERVVGSRGFPSDMPDYFDGIPLSSGTAGGRTIETGAAEFYPDSADLVRAFPRHRHYRDMAAFAFLPLTVSGRTFGCCVLGYDAPRPFTPDERAELTSLAGMIAQALERARLYDANARIARGLQDGLLPRIPPTPPGLGVAARYRPATHALDVGGDFYDLIDFDDSTVAAVIGDVQGHSVPAAALMGQIRTAVHTHARVGAPPDEVLARTNRLLFDLDSALFTSCLYAHVDVVGARALLASAGHPPPILRYADRRTEVLDLPPGLLLGVDADAHYQTVEVPLPSGSLLALYTDGLVERPGTDLGAAIDDLAARLAGADPQPLDLLADMLVRQAEETVVPEASDDIALLLVGCERSEAEAGPGTPGRGTG
ncbi:SpoIIE family protein phosphatase [Streptomyces sulfonofaciens]|uniref:SpoIIE family protein phosphatase n=1 Tax=Streptomyces sulfonofaciens TaxID=68272 RepID=UPI001E516BFD|nr:SpoIIE family protein phosphatase [Streptomyces sulfonofaciens]